MYDKPLPKQGVIFTSFVPMSEMCKAMQFEPATQLTVTHPRPYVTNKTVNGSGSHDPRGSRPISVMGEARHFKFHKQINHDGHQPTHDGLPSQG